jgi:hypothetical protein
MDTSITTSTLTIEAGVMVGTTILICVAADIVPGTDIRDRTSEAMAEELQAVDPMEVEAYAKAEVEVSMVAGREAEVSMVAE